MKARSKRIIKRGLWLFAAGLLVLVAVMGFLIYKKIFYPNVPSTPGEQLTLYIKSGSNFEDVVKTLTDQKLIIDQKSFRFTAEQMQYPGKVKPGRYVLKPGMTNKELISLLRSGRQTPVRLVIHNVRLPKELAEKVAGQLELSSSALLNLMEDEDYTRTLGFSTEEILALFLPNTYEFYWTTSADQFMQRMKREYDKFWNGARQLQAREIGFTPLEVSVLASIVQQETNRNDEKPRVAGVYINRLKKGWRLEADPTLVYALGDFTINRVLNIHKKIVSPYNTYLNEGLPPGPICLATQNSILAVLNYEKHDYMYFCAREDFSGYHNFASTYTQHLLNARRFQKALNERGIKS